MEAPLRVFGSAARTRVLLTLALLDCSFPREIARVSGVPLLSTQRIINDLELQRLVASRLHGNQREVRLNPLFFAYAELRALLLRLSESDVGLTDIVASLRRRPRRAGKAL